MAYIGYDGRAADIKKIDTIAPQFNSVATNFAILVNGSSYAPATAAAMLISVGGVIQEPYVDYNISGANLIFTAAQTTGASFFGIVLGASIAIGTVSDSTITNAKIGETISIAKGGTGAITADAALSSLGGGAVGKLVFAAATQATARAQLALGTSATQDVGTSVDNVVQLVTGGKLPAVDGSLLTGIATTPADGSITAAKLSGTQSGSAPVYGVRAWCTFNGASTGTNAPTTGGNVTSITRGGVGIYTGTLSVAMPTSQFSVCATNAAQNTFVTAYASSTTTFVILIANNGGALFDGATVSVQCIC